MAEPISIQQLKDASEDAISLAEFIYKPANVMIPRRLAADINSLQYYLDYMSSYAQHSYETYDEMVANAVNLPNGVSVFVTNNLDTAKNGIYTYNGTSFVKGDYQPENAAKEFVEAKLGGLEVFDGKVRAQDISTADGSTQAVKNTEFRNELDALPFEGGVLAADLVDIGLGLTQKDFNYGVSSVVAMLSLPNPSDGIVVNTASYLAGKKVGGNTYRYNSARAAENDGGSIINGWEVVGKTEFTPEDFGALPSVETLDNDAALRKFILSGLNLVVPDNTTYSFSIINSFDITKPLFLKGGGMYSSIIKRLSLYFETDDSKVTDVGLHTLVPQYTCYIRKGSRNVFTRVYTYHNYDGFAIYRKVGLPESEKLSGNQFIDCISEKSGRVGFTVDIGAYETLVDGCRAIDCRQGFHVEGAETTWIKRGVSERCGLLAAFNTGENVGYEGSIRSYGVKGLYVDGFENINPNGRCLWQHGAASIGSSDLVFKNMKGTGGLSLDDEIGTTTNLTVQNVDDFGVFQNNAGQRITGTLRVEDSGNFTNVAQFGTTSCDLIVFRNTNLGLTSIETIQADGTIILDNTSFAHSRVCIFGAAHIQITNGIANKQLSQSDPDFFQGLRFDAVRLKTFFCDVIRLTGAGTGTHLSFYNAASPVQNGRIGSIVADISYAIGYNAYKSAGYDTFTLLGISFDNRKFNRLDAIPTSGTWSVGDTVYKNSVIADTIYGWVCTTAGTGAAAVWQPLKYSS